MKSIGIGYYEVRVFSTHATKKREIQSYSILAITPEHARKIALRCKDRDGDIIVISKK